jgi:hypothetical protein
VACFDETRLGRARGTHRDCGGRLFKVGHIRHGLESRCFLDQCGACGVLVAYDRQGRRIGEASVGATPRRRDDATPAPEGEPAVNATSTPTGLAPVLERPGPPTGLGGMRAVQAAIEELQAFREFVKSALKPGLDFGKIPNTGTKPTLLQPGAQKINMLFNSRPEHSTERFDLGGGHVEFIVTTRLISRVNDREVGQGIGSASTMESKYRWRHEERTCPECGQPAIIKGREDYGGGWVCFKKKGGCGAKYHDGDRSIEGQQVGRVENPDIADVRNTVLKIAVKRSLVAAALGLSCASEMFTQDLDEFASEAAEEWTQDPAPRSERRSQTPRDRDEPRRSPGRELYNWARDEGKRTGLDLVKYLNNWGKLQEYPARMIDWDAGQAQLGRKEAERKLSSLQPADATQAQRPRKARTWEELVGLVLARWAELKPAADVKEAESRRYQLIHGLGTRAIAAGKVEEGRTLKEARAGREPARDLGKTTDELRALFDREPRWLRAQANAYLNEKLGVPTVQAPAPAASAPTSDPDGIPPLAPPPDAGAAEAWVADGDALARWSEEVEEKTGVPLNRFLAEAAAELGLSSTWRDWTGEQVEDLHRRAVAHVRDTLRPPAE